MDQLKKWLSNLLLVCISTLVGVALMGPLFWPLISQENMPRALVKRVGKLQSSFYADTFNRDSTTSPYTAILGDSYAQGQGDGFLSGIVNYSVAHMLRAADGGNYLGLGHSGHGSMKGVRALRRNLAWTRSSPFVPDFDDPQRILYFFYEGNDINNNLLHLEYLGVANGASEELLAEKIREGSDFNDASPDRRRDLVSAWLPFGDLVRRPDKLLELLIRRGGKPKADSSHETPAAWIRAASKVKPLQCAACELEIGQLQRGLRVFFGAMDSLKEQFPGVPIHVIYIPSVVSSYHLDGDITVQLYHAGERKSARVRIAKNTANHEFLVENMRKGLQQRGIGFTDSTGAVRVATRTQIVHGPIDTKHFNLAGYRVLAQVSAKALAGNAMR